MPFVFVVLLYWVCPIVCLKLSLLQALCISGNGSLCNMCWSRSNHLTVIFNFYNVNTCIIYQRFVINIFQTILQISLHLLLFSFSHCTTNFSGSIIFQALAGACADNQCQDGNKCVKKGGEIMCTPACKTLVFYLFHIGLVCLLMLDRSEIHYTQFLLMERSCVTGESHTNFMSTNKIGDKNNSP